MIAQNCERGWIKAREEPALIKTPVRLVRLVRSDKSLSFQRSLPGLFLPFLPKRMPGVSDCQKAASVAPPAVCQGKQIAGWASTCVSHTTGKKSKNYKIIHSLALQ